VNRFIPPPPPAPPESEANFGPQLY
jgi:hypothetical protein